MRKAENVASSRFHGTGKPANAARKRGNETRKVFLVRQKALDVPFLAFPET
jgi:hypothetical protein